MDIWTFQFILCGLVFVFFVCFWYWNYYILEEPIACSEPPFEPWIFQYIFFVCGASSGQTFLQYFRAIMAHFSSTEGKLRHPNAMKMILVIATIHAFGLYVFYSDLIPYTCSSMFGVKTPPIIWLEWNATVPFMFFSASMLDVKRTAMKALDWKIEILSALSLFCLFLTTFHINGAIRWAAFILSNVFMVVALHLQITDAMQEYNTAEKEYRAWEKMFKEGKDTADIISQTKGLFIDQDKYRREIYDRFQVAMCKVTATTLIFVTFNVYPIAFYAASFEFVSAEVFNVFLVYFSFATKFLLTQILIDSHMEILDPNKFVIFEERKKFDENRLMFFRYVFHEIRVPLNSICLGIQLLKENKSLPVEETETLQMVHEATNFMSETLNDVLSLQKLEGGQLQLEYKVFAPFQLMRSVLYNFRPQYEGKEITVTSVIDDNVPEFIYADQFRLEHVLANLLSNAIKFSDPHSAIEVRVSYNTRMAGYVTFSVKDEGVGMSAEDQKQLFQPFKQIRPGELQKGRGSGLGLSICKMIVTLHEGSIGCESKKREVVGDVKSGGSEFFFNIKHDAEKVNTLLKEQGIPVVPHISLSMSDSHSNPITPGHKISPRVYGNADDNFLPGSETDDTNGNSTSPRMPSKTIFNNFNDMQELKIQHAKKISHAGGRRNGSFDSVSSSALGSPRCEETNYPIQSSGQSNTTEKELTINLPTTEPSQSELPPPTSRYRKPMKDYNILVVDDVLSNRKMLAMILKKKGFTADQCFDGADAVQTVQAKGIQFYDIIFMDSLMPNMCGPEAAKTLRGLGFSKLIVGVTGNAMDTDITDFEQNGADVIFTKPMKVELMERLFVYCEKHGSHSRFAETDEMDQRQLKHYVYKD